MPIASLTSFNYGQGFAVDASLIVADANKQRSIPGSEWTQTLRRWSWTRLCCGGTPRVGAGTQNPDSYKVDSAPCQRAFQAAQGPDTLWSLEPTGFPGILILDRGHKLFTGHNQ